MPNKSHWSAPKLENRFGVPEAEVRTTRWSQEGKMSEMIIRPTMKFIYIGYALTILIVGALAVALMRLWPASIPTAWQTWIPWLPALLLLWPLKCHLRN